MRLCTAGFELVAVLLDDLDLARRHRPGDLLDRNNEGCREAFRNFLAVLFSRAEDDISACAHGHGGDRTSPDLAGGLDFHLTHRKPDREIVGGGLFSTGDERTGERRVGEEGRTRWGPDY